MSCPAMLSHKSMNFNGYTMKSSFSTYWMTVQMCRLRSIFWSDFQDLKGRLIHQIYQAMHLSEMSTPFCSARVSTESLSFLMHWVCPIGAEKVNYTLYVTQVVKGWIILEKMWGLYNYLITLTFLFTSSTHYKLVKYMKVPFWWILTYNSWLNVKKYKRFDRP